MSNRTTLADVAKAAGVSMMTVSRAINYKDGVSEATRQRILAIADEMNFHPNGIAQGLATKRTATIGLVVPDISNPFFSQIALGVEDIAHANRYNVFLLNNNEDKTREQNALNSLWRKQVDGLILCSSRLPQPELDSWLKRFPYAVLVNRDLPAPMPNVVSLVVDEAAGMKQAVTYFVEHGRRVIAFIAGPAHSFSSQQRQAGFVEACALHQLEMPNGRIVMCDPTSEGGYTAAKALLAADPVVDGIVAFNDLAAVGAMQACVENGRLIPDDIAIIGIDDIPLAALVTPSLSTLRIDKYKLGEQAMQTLLQLIGHSDDVEISHHAIQPSLILRHSTP